jgi:hypothetical protein
MTEVSVKVCIYEAECQRWGETFPIWGISVPELSYEANKYLWIYTFSYRNSPQMLDMCQDQVFSGYNVFTPLTDDQCKARVKRDIAYLNRSRHAHLTKPVVWFYHTFKLVR